MTGLERGTATSNSTITGTTSAAALNLETALALGEFLELDSRIVLDMETAMPAILKGVEHINS
jgi:hypothetical protein